MPSRLTRLGLGGALFAATFVIASGAAAQPDIKKERSYWRKQLERVQKKQPANPIIYEAHMNLARIEEHRSNFLWAQLHFEKALSFQERELGPKHIKIADTLEAMAEFYMRWRSPEQCETHEQSRVAPYSNEYGNEPLSAIYITRCTPAEGPAYVRAAQLLERAFEIRQSSAAISPTDRETHLERLCRVQILAGARDKTRAYNCTECSKDRELMNRLLVSVIIQILLW